MVSSVVLMLLIITLLRIFTDFWLGRWINDGNGNSVRYNFCESFKTGLLYNVLDVYQDNSNMRGVFHISTYITTEIFLNSKKGTSCYKLVMY